MTTPTINSAMTMQMMMNLTRTRWRIAVPRDQGCSSERGFLISICLVIAIHWLAPHQRLGFMLRQVSFTMQHWRCTRALWITAIRSRRAIKPPNTGHLWAQLPGTGHRQIFLTPDA